SQCLDHLVVFLPANPDTKLPQIPPFFEENFTLTPGGIHADGATSNTLILLSDGCYIELISFISECKFKNHWWGPDAQFSGWKDWCLTNTKSPEENHNSLKETHAEPQHGGRKRADGVDVKWAVTFPKGDIGGQSVRGRIPFFCHDVTPRDVRVPLSTERTTHPCGAQGVAQITIIVKDQNLLQQTKQVYTSILGDGMQQSGNEVIFNAGRVHDVKMPPPGRGAQLILRLPKNEQEQDATAESGYYYGDIVLGARADANNTSTTKTRLDGGDVDIRGLWLDYV
ncbi:glyoxalase-like domain-containing protein, partial [Paraphoma chrysanthemicola]